jgi:hypothetical protein
MDSLAHGLWSGAAAIAINNLNVISTQGYSLRTGWFVFWGVFPDVLAFGPMALTGIWLRLAGSAEGSVHGGHIPHVDLGIPLYPAAHSLITFAMVYGASTILARRPPRALLGWLLHILIDIPTHSLSYYATRFLWPVADYRFDGVAWWTPWLLYMTYGGLLLTYLLLWTRGWLRRSPPAAFAKAPPR